MNNTADGSRTDEVIALEGVELRRGGRLLLDGIDWHVRAGECAAIVGPNGAGKSTLLSVIGGFTWPQEGRVRVFGETYGRVELATLRRRMGFAGSSRMPQFHDDQTAFEVVLAGRYGATVVPPRVEPTGPDLDAVERQLAVVGLAGRAQMEMGKLSSGEQMRVLLARALVADPGLLILDEPTTALDLAARASFTAALEALQAANPGLTILLVTHHVEDLPRQTGTVLLLAGGRALAAGAPADVLTGPLLSQAYACEVQVFQEDGRFWTRVRRPPQWSF